MPFGPFALQWRAPSPNPPQPSSPLPECITRRYISTPSGPLELLSAFPTGPKSSKPPLFFAHGGFGCASVWLSYMTYFSSRGYPCYAISYRGHGSSWYPGFWRMYFTSRGTMAEDLVAGVKEVERLETETRSAEEKVRVVLVAHSAGGALSQYALSKGLVKVHGFCMLAAVPGFGSWSVYKFWSLTAPIHFPYRLFHPRYILATTKQVHDAFFTASTPTRVVKDLEALLSPYESMLWPMQAAFRFVTGPDVISSVVGWRLRKGSGSNGFAGVAPRLLVLAGEKDVLCTPSILRDAATRYGEAFHHCARVGKLDGISESDVRVGGGKGDGWDGVSFKVATGLGHHLQNHVNWESGAEEILRWVQKL
ncbi:alpha/beta-hydrolase [Macroventuria anomochaeta]|uniref:Alpha/beta-hydrolase n=1 Tax=Macroventuria anomochaeta TaxID=301207 RepID=A0ACB6SD01_9PLEO|nr:alpha/beta-hydrolase [Macroventuria anomochaeta]KAF2631134.1 alpha/beta-hydrolase [Macroventuria anomochaeta]